MINPVPSPTAFAVILLAAGKSSRMGRSKMLLPWRQTTVLGHLAAQWQKLGARQIAVVCAPDDEAIAAELNRIEFPASDRIVNPDPARGMFSSIQSAARWTGWSPDLTHWIIALGDQPHLKPATLTGLLEFSRVHPDGICQPTHRGRPRHPIVLPRPAWNELARTEVETLKHFLEGKSSELARVELIDPGLDLDLDHPEDYEKALRLDL